MQNLMTILNPTQVRALRRMIAVSTILATCMISSVVWSAETLVFGTYAFEKPTETVRKIRPILNALEREIERQTGRRIAIRLQVAKNYRTAIRDLVTGRVDFGRYGQAAYVMAKAANRKLDVIVSEGDHKKKTFKSLIVVRDESPIRRVTDLAGRSFAFGNEYSTTGRYMPQAFLARAGLTISDFRETTYLKRHDQVGAAISDGRYDAGAISEWVFRDMIGRGTPLRSIASFSNTTKPWVAREGLPADVREVIRQSLIALRGVKVLDKIKKDCFLPGKDHDYTQARTAIADNWEFFVGSEEIPMDVASGPPEDN